MKIRALSQITAASAVLFSQAPLVGDQSVADFKAEAAPTPPAARPPPESVPGSEIFSANGAEIHAVAGGFHFHFDDAPLAEAAVALARVWHVPVAYFGPTELRTNASFIAASLSAALLALTDRSPLQSARRGDTWCLEMAPSPTDTPPSGHLPIPPR